MAVCEMCGKEGEIICAIVEGTRLNVCPYCAKFGQVIKKPVFKPIVKTNDKEEVVETIVPDFAKLIHDAREKSGLTQKDFALKLNEKESFIHKLENGSMKPSIDLARKLEHALKIKLVVVEHEESVSVEKKASGPLTIGDLIKIKK